MIPVSVSAGNVDVIHGVCKHDLLICKVKGLSLDSREERKEGICMQLASCEVTDSSKLHHETDLLTRRLRCWSVSWHTVVESVALQLDHTNQPIRLILKKCTAGDSIFFA